MKMLIAVLIALMVTASSAFAADAQVDQVLLQKARHKTWAGIALVGIGAFVLPVTNTSKNTPSSAELTTGLAAIATGSVLLWSGAQDRRKASPHTQLSVAVGRRTMLWVQRVW